GRDLGEGRFFGEVLEGEGLFASERAGQLDLPVFQRHVRRLVQPRQFRGLAAFALCRAGLPLPFANLSGGAVLADFLLLPLHDMDLPGNSPAWGRRAVIGGYCTRRQRRIQARSSLGDYPLRTANLSSVHTTVIEANQTIALSRRSS